MKYLIDTNIISELVKIKPNVNVVNFIESINSESLYLSVITIGEIRKGIDCVSNITKKVELQKWLENDLFERFKEQIIDVNIEIAEKWGYLSSLYNIPAIDCLIAATAISRNLTFLTRNVRDFNKIKSLEIINPFNT